MSTMPFPDIPRLYTAIAEWLACMVYIAQLPLRIRGWRLAGVSAGMLAGQCLFLVFTGDAPLFLWIPCMIAAIGLMLALFCACCNLSILDACYHCIRAFLLAEFAAALEWQLYFYTLFRLGWYSKVWEVLCLVVIYTGVFVFIFLLERRRKEATQYFKVTPRETISAVAIGMAAFLMSNLSYAYSNTPFSGGFVTDIFNTRTLVDLGGLAILYAYHVQRGELHMRYELDSIQNVLQNQYAQYRQSRESIDVINRKYHDLKHQIAALRAESDPERRAAWLDEMEEDIKTYEAQNKTGNPVLDTVLTSKSLYCQKHGITLTCVADGTRLGFMSVMDICTIFGNALDNAIECELRIADKSKRLIHVTVAVQKSFLLLRFENYYEGTLEFEGGLPVTTKQNKAYHGFGIKSIRYTAAKYGGSVTVNTKDNWFEMKVLFPLPKNSGEDKEQTR